MTHKGQVVCDQGPGDEQGKQKQEKGRNHKEVNETVWRAGDERVEDWEAMDNEDQRKDM